MEILKHENTYVNEDQLGGNPRAYRRTLIPNNSSMFINDNHKFLSTTLTDPQHPNLISYKGIDGWLTVPDALKLYEMAYFSDFNILELGSYQGLSTTILAEALKDANSKNHIISADISKENTNITISNLTNSKLLSYVDVRCIGAESLFVELINLKSQFSFIFIDHSHTYNDVTKACEILPLILQDGGFAMFHDFSNRAGNICGNNVFLAVENSLSNQLFEFHGCFGCSGLFRLKL